MYNCSLYIERWMIELVLRWFSRKHHGHREHRVFYNSTDTAITVMHGNCQVEEHGGDHRVFATQIENLPQWTSV